MSDPAATRPLKLVSPSPATDERQLTTITPARVQPFDGFREITDDAMQGIMIHKGDHRPVYVNSAWAELHGFTVDEIMAMPHVFGFVHESEKERLSGYARRRMQGIDVPTRYRYRAVHKSGRLIWLEQFVRMFDWKGERFLQSTIIDVDDQERRVHELRQLERTMKREALERAEALDHTNQRLHILRSVIDQMSERIAVVGTDYRYRMTNLANARFRQATSDEMVGQPVQDFVGERWFQRSGKAMLDRAFAGQQGKTERTEVGPGERRFHSEVTMEPYRESDGRIGGAIVSVRDVTAAKEAEDQLRLFASAMEQVSDRISVIGQDYRFRLTNKANRDFHQLPIEAFLNRPIVEIVGEEQFYERVKPDLDRCFAGERVYGQRHGSDRNGDRYAYDVILVPYREADGSLSGAIVTLRDVTKAHQLSRRLAHQARFDQLTGLINRRAFEHCLDVSIEETAGGGRSDALCFIDLDQFKIVNDTVGHLVGDELLKDVAKLLSGKLKGGDVLARLGGDEFALLLHRCSLRRAKRAAEQLLAALNDFQFFHEGLMFDVGASIGITAINRYVTNASDVMAQADLACYAAKDQGRNRVQIFQKRDVVMRRRREEMYRAGGIRAALDNHQFVLFAQPILPIEAGGDGAGHVEILIRMRGDQGRLVMPSAFIPAAERYGFMAELDRWVIRRTLRTLSHWPRARRNQPININLSGVTLNDETLLDFIRQTLALSTLSPGQITFEITETAAIRDIATTQAFMEELRSWGCRFALDDFGSGLSSLNYLKRLPVDFLKIDGSFVRDVAKDHGSQVVVQAIGQMAKGLGIRTVAEGVEDLAVLQTLKTIGIDYVQGFAIGRPIPFDQYDVKLTNG